MNKIQKILSNPLLPVAKVWEACSCLIPSDRLFISVSYWLRIHERLHWHNPKKFNEKIQWLKLYARLPLYTQMVDKYSVREIVEEKVGKQYCVPLLGVYDSVDEIDLNALPNQFVLKTTHDSGSVVICRDKNTFDFEKGKETLKKSLKTNYYLKGREYPYKKVKRRIIAEEFLSDGTGDLNDYKFFVFNGNLKMVFVTSERFSGKEGVKFDWLDLDFQPLPFHSKGHLTAWPNVHKPDNFEEMKELVRKLIIPDTPLLRIDLYSINGKIYFGEYTFFHDGGLVALEPYEWNEKIGAMIDISNVK